MGSFFFEKISASVLPIVGVAVSFPQKYYLLGRKIGPECFRR